MAQSSRGRRFIVGISGASGTALAVATIRALALHAEVERIHLIATANAIRVASSEMDDSTGLESIIGAAALDQPARQKIEVHPDRDIGAIIASGSYLTDGMVIVPCSSGMLASIAHGISRGLIQRAADLMLKERRRLIIGLRETPFSLIHAENIVTVTRAGAIVMPPIPPFYAAQTWEEFISHYAMRVLDLFGLENTSDSLRWDPARDREAEGR